MSAQFVERVAVVPDMLSDAQREELSLLKITHDVELFAWAVRELVHLGDSENVSFGDDVVAVSRSLCKHTTVVSLLKAWICECRKRMGLREIAEARVQQLLSAQVINYTTPDGFRTVASQFKQHSPTLSMETNAHSVIYRPSTPPATTMNGVVSVFQ